MTTPRKILTFSYDDGVSQDVRLFELGEKFLALQPDKKQIFYVWGHAYEFDIHNSRDRFEEFLNVMSGKADIAYLTNKEALL